MGKKQKALTITLGLAKEKDAWSRRGESRPLPTPSSAQVEDSEG